MITLSLNVGELISQNRQLNLKRTGSRKYVNAAINSLRLNNANYEVALINKLSGTL